MGFPGGSDGKESACNTGDRISIPGLGRFPGESMTTHSSIFAKLQVSFYFIYFYLLFDLAV